MTYKEEQAFGALVDIVKRNAETAEAPVGIDREAFLAAVHVHPDQVDMTRLAGLSKRGFVQAAYACFFHRYPDEGALQVWQDQENLSNFQYKQKLTESLRNSGEAKLKQISVRNNLFTTGRAEEVRTMVVTGYGRLDRLYAVYARLPGFLKRFAKKILR